MKTAASTQRDYQYGFSEKGTAMYDVTGRERKAHTMVAVLQSHLGQDLQHLTLLNIGGSTGIIDGHLAQHFQSVTSIDIDQAAIQYAQTHFSTDNLQFALGDAMELGYDTSSFDVIVCSQVYEHVPDASKMMQEIHRVLKLGGICYFAAGNRLMWNEPHYNLPLLSILPRFIADQYVKVMSKGDHYYEKHLTYWGLKQLTHRFTVHDYTARMLRSPQKFGIDYMVKPNTIKGKLAQFLSEHLLWLVPGYIWLLEK
ncbi:class I SAM-dependent methyltransferase [Thiothrix lacustris]|uniref:class I SAM-dependent methyltransferase n=1 Tax=Thiothrix lacustris TaxID=525917 RepID=UPI0027E54D16|nr:class I SAM-dependent methyltransferase [Thiothrix lacustris]WMP18891.1 class I SAM-dependent methyltransferase [Thiothrix lacustris]